MLRPYISPEKLLGASVLPMKCEFAFICYCPMPEIFNKYKMDVLVKHRCFIHSHNCHVMFCKFNEKNFVVVAEVYGGPVSVTTVEELAFYGINKIIGIGFVGSLIKSIKIGDKIYGESAFIEAGTTPHYHKSGDIYTYPTGLNIIRDEMNIRRECIWTTNALYREYPDDVDKAKNMLCTVVNMDTSHFYAACSFMNIGCEYYAVVSDHINEEWNNELTSAVNVTDTTNPVINAQTDLISTILNNLSYNDTH